MAVSVHGTAGLGLARLARGFEAQRQQQKRQISSVSSWQKRASQLSVATRFVRTQQRIQQPPAVLVVKAAAEGVDAEVEVKVAGDVLPSHEWPENFSLLNFEDLSAHYEPALYKAEAQPGTFLGDVMSKTLFTAFPEQTLAEVEHFFNDISGFPVVDADYKVVGVVSKKDRAKAVEGKYTKVKYLMSSPAITLFADKTVQDAAVLMLKNKIHRIPIVNSDLQAVGIVTRTDIFTALANDESS